MDFKSWLEATASDTFFQHRDKIQKTNIGQLLGFKVPLVKITQGSLATIYQHPNNPNWIIKVTSHLEDVKNTYKAQKLNSPNIVKMFGKPQQVPQHPESYWMLEEKINGKSMVYDTGSFIALIHGDRMSNLKRAMNDIIYAENDRTRTKILDSFNMNTDEECSRLSDLFKTLYELERIGIEMSDFGDNILDDEKKYVIVDLGF